MLVYLGRRVGMICVFNEYPRELRRHFLEVCCELSEPNSNQVEAREKYRQYGFLSVVNRDRFSRALCPVLRVCMFCWFRCTRGCGLFFLMFYRNSKVHMPEDEPIHIPGASQSFGALLALKYSPAGDLEVRVASENVRQLLEYGAEDLIELKSFFDIIEVESGGDMSARIQFALSKARIADDNISDTDLDILPVSIILPDDSQKKLWCALHISKGIKDLIVCEFEVHSNVFYPEDVLDTRALPKVPVSTVGLEVEVEESLKSTVPTSKPLRVLDIARRRKQSGLSSMDIFSAMTQAQQQLASARSVQAVLDIVVGIVAEITGFHRVMFYQFDSQKNGCVKAELIKAQASVDIFRGMFLLDIC